jgi:fluoride exporter
MAASLHPVFWIFVGGGLGSACRYLLATWVMTQLSNPGFPWGTFTVNVLGCAVGGAVAALAEKTLWLTPDLRLFLFTGILGGFTTFSAFGLETLNLIKSGQTFTALAYVLASVVLGVLAMSAVYWATTRW